MVDRSFIATIRMVEKWDPAFFVHLYDQCINKWEERRFNSPTHMWWTEWKKQN